MAKDGKSVANLPRLTGGLVPKTRSAALAGVPTSEADRPRITGTRFYRDGMAKRLQAMIDGENEIKARALLEDFLLREPEVPLLSILDLPKETWAKKLMEESPALMKALARPVDPSELRPAVEAEFEEITGTALETWLELVEEYRNSRLLS